MNIEPTPEHAWLQQLVGEWTYEMEAPGKPGEQPEKFTGTDSVRSIGSLWIQGEGRGVMPDGRPAISQLTLGYDSKAKRYVGTWIGSMMDFLWVYTGSRQGNRLTLDTVGPNFDVPGTTANYREILELVGPNDRTFTSSVQAADGTWSQMMSMHYRRTS